MSQSFLHSTKGTLTDLTADRKYVVWVTASTTAKEGEKSNEITVETCELSL